MSLNIKNVEAERLARQLAQATGETVTRAIAVAVRERLDRVQQGDRAGFAERGARAHQIALDAAGRWVRPLGDADHGDVLYDARGLPR